MNTSTRHVPAKAREVPDRASDPLLGKMWKTKGARFNAHRRLSNKHSLSTIAISILSFYLFAASLIDLFQHQTAGASPSIPGMLVVIISVFVLIISLLENSRNYQREADRMHQCALEISELYNRFQSLPIEQADTERMQYADLYSEILRRFEVDHKEVDFIRFQISYARDLGIRPIHLPVLYGKYFVYWGMEYIFYTSLLVAPPVVLFIYRHQVGW
jgi:hypothetical protein